MLGTLEVPEFKDRILFLEDVGEKPYRLDRMLTQLLNAGILQQVAGVAVGANGEGKEDKTGLRSGEYVMILATALCLMLGSEKLSVVRRMIEKDGPHQWGCHRTILPLFPIRRIFKNKTRTALITKSS
jgi:hypothetical protein